MQEQI